MESSPNLKAEHLARVKKDPGAYTGQILGTQTPLSDDHRAHFNEQVASVTKGKTPHVKSLFASQTDSVQQIYAPLTSKAHLYSS